MKFIPLDAVLAEIEKRIKVLQENPYENHKTICHLDSLKQSINTLEVKEVDLKKEIDTYLSSYWPNEKELHPFLGHMAKHFFELGVNASNPPTWEDINSILYIERLVLREFGGQEQSNEELCREVLKRFKVQK